MVTEENAKPIKLNSLTHELIKNKYKLQVKVLETTSKSAFLYKFKYSFKEMINRFLFLLGQLSETGLTNLRKKFFCWMLQGFQGHKIITLYINLFELNINYLN